MNIWKKNVRSCGVYLRKLAMLASFGVCLAALPSGAWAQDKTDTTKTEPREVPKKAAPPADTKTVITGAKEISKDATKNADQGDKVVLAGVKAEKKKVLKNGWFPKLSLGASLSLAHASSVPGIEDGLTMNIGIVIDGALLYRYDRHEWKSTLKFIHTQTKVPVYEPFIKTADNLDIQTYYGYLINKEYKAGFHIGGQFNVALFPGALVLNTDTNTKLLPFDRKQEAKDGPQAKRGEPFALTSGFSPLILKGKAGFEVEPYEDLFARLNIKLDLVGQQVITGGGGLAVDDDATTPELELRELEDYAQFGLGFDIYITGDINKQISYSFAAELMYPFVTSVVTDLRGFDLLNADLSLKVSFKLAKWVSVDYTFLARRVPLLTEKWQVSNSLVLALKADIL